MSDEVQAHIQAVYEKWDRFFRALDAQVREELARLDGPAVPSEYASAMAPSITLYEESGPIGYKGPEVYKVGWLAIEGANLLLLTGDADLIALARWLKRYGEPGDSGFGQYLIPELVELGPGEDGYIEALQRLCAITNALETYIDQERTSWEHFTALFELLGAAEDACATPMIWG